jgi:hypothetical protein
MSLTNIKLPGFVIADLYRNTLIQPEGPMLPQEVQAQAVAEPAPQPVVKQPAHEPVTTMPAEKKAEPAPRVVAEPQPATKSPVPEPILATAPEKKAEPAAYKVLGNNKKQITVVVNCPNDVFVPEADLQFLTKMLEACKLNMADVAIVNHATAAIAIDRLKVQLQPRYLLLFGVEPGAIQLPISFPSFKDQPYAGTTYLFTPALGQFNQETDEAKQLKRKLWDCLKRMFL